MVAKIEEILFAETNGFLCFGFKKRKLPQKSRLFAYITSWKQSTTQEKKPQSNVSQVKQSQYAKIQLPLNSTKNGQKKSSERSCPWPFNWDG